MASKGTISGPYFFIFDFYVMTGADDSNDVLPKAVLYFYSTDDQTKEQKLLECGEMVGIVQYFQHDLFRSIARTLYFQKLFVAHKHYGRHSAFLCAPDDRYTTEEADIYLKHILNLFSMLYGTWNHIQSTYERDDQIYDFLNRALTPIVNYVFNQHRSISNLFSTIEYTLLKSGNQRVLLESKHYLGFLKSKYGLHDGFIGYDDKILYSTCDPDTTFYLQLLFQLRNELSENLVIIPWEEEFRLRNGVFLFRIYIRQPLIPRPARRVRAPVSRGPSFQITTAPRDIFNVLPSTSNNSLSSSQNNPHRLSIPSSIPDQRRSGMLVFTDHSGSSEDTGCETDTADELASPRILDAMSSSSLSVCENPNDLNTEDSNSSLSPSGDEGPLTDEQKLKKNLRSRSSTVSDDMEQTVKINRKGSIDELVNRIHLVQVESMDTSDDDQEIFRTFNRRLSETVRERTSTVTTNPDSLSDRLDAQVTWKNIPDKNTEQERDQLVLYIQRNSRMMFAGILEQGLLTNDYLTKLWNLMLSQMANMETEIQVIPTANEIIRLTTDVKFQFNENTCHAEFERIFDGIRYSRRIPSEESAHMALFARTELNRNPERKVIGLSRGSHLVSIDRRLPDRITYSCRRVQENL